MIPSSADLSYFAMIAQTLNISRASDRLGISQPSLSLAIQRLENIVGTDLLIRNKRGVELTQAGKQLLAHTTQMLEDWKNIKAKTLASVEEVQGNYTIGCHTSMALNILTSVIPCLLEKHPDLSINLNHDLSRNTTEDVIAMKTDMAIAVNPTLHPDLIIHPLYQGELTFWTAAHAQKKSQDPHSNEAILLSDPNLIRSQSLIKKAQEQGFQFSRMLHSSSLEVLADIVGQGCGIGILPINVAERAPKKLVRLKDAPAFYDDHSLIYRVENKNVRSLQVIRDTIKAHLQQSG